MKRGTIYLVSQSAAAPQDRADGKEWREPGGAILRPVVLVSRNAINRHGAVLLVCPLVEAAGVHQLYPSDVPVNAPEGGLTVDSVVLTGQLRALARTQLVRYLGELSPEVMGRVDQALRITLDLE